MILATPDDLLLFFDASLIGDLAADDHQVPIENLHDNPRILAILNAASGMVLSAIRRGNRYTLEDLYNLDEFDSNFLKSIICSVAFLKLLSLRGNSYSTDIYENLKTEIDNILNSLANGERVFSSTSASQAGLPKTGVPELANILKLNLLTDKSRRYYPPRSNTYPL